MNDHEPASAGGPAGPPATPTLVIYARPGCHLCEDALAVIERVRGLIPFTLEQVDIDSDDALFKRYLERIPVITIDGREAFELFVDEGRLASALSAADRRTASQ